MPTIHHTAPDGTTRSVPFGPAPLTVGRGLSCGLAIDSPELSREHFRLYARADGGIDAEDLASVNGVIVNGAKLDSRVTLQPADVMSIGGHLFTRTLPAASQGAATPVRAAALPSPASAATPDGSSGSRPAVGPATAAFGIVVGKSTTPMTMLTRTVTIGSGPESDIEVRNPSLARRHVRIVPTATGARIVDLGSRSGTTVDGKPVNRADVGPGAQILLGGAVPVRVVATGHAPTKPAVRDAPRPPAPAVKPGIVATPDDLPPAHAPILVYTGADGRPTSHRLAAVDTTIGRADFAGLTLAEPMASREHVRISRTPDGVFMAVDLASSNGTFINGVELSAPRALALGDRIEIGATVMTFSPPESAAGGPVPFEAVRPGSADRAAAFAGKPRSSSGGTRTARRKGNNPARQAASGSGSAGRMSKDERSMAVTLSVLVGMVLVAVALAVVLGGTDDPGDPGSDPSTRAVRNKTQGEAPSNTPTPGDGTSTPTSEGGGNQPRDPVVPENPPVVPEQTAGQRHSQEAWSEEDAQIYALIRDRRYGVAQERTRTFITAWESSLDGQLAVASARSRAAEIREAAMDDWTDQVRPRVVGAPRADREAQFRAEILRAFSGITPVMADAERLLAAEGQETND